jgi:hypothetical protein
MAAAASDEPVVAIQEVAGGDVSWCYKQFPGIIPTHEDADFDVQSDYLS